MRFLRRAFAGLFLLTLTIGMLAFAGGVFLNALAQRAADDTSRPGNREQIFSANVVSVAPQTVNPVMTAFGQIESRRTLEVRTPQGGRILALGSGVAEGGRVSAGQVLFQMDPVEDERALAIAETDLKDAEGELDDARIGAELAIDELASAEAQVGLRQRAFRRQQDLEERGVGTATAIETAEAGLFTAEQAVLAQRQALAAATARVNQATTRLARAQIALDEAQRVLDDAQITAAFDGVLSDVSAVEGGLLVANERLANLIDPTTLEVAFRVSTAEYARLLDADGQLRQADAVVILEGDGFALESPATITRESAAVGEGQSGRLLFARLAQPLGFRPDDFARVAVKEPALEGVARLPSTALDASGTVLVLGEDNRLERADVTLMRRQGDTVLVRAPDLAGREVVAERGPALGAGIAVRPVRPQTADTPAAPDYVELTDERRAKLVAFVEANTRIPTDAKARVLAQLREARVPARVVERIEGRMGG